MRRPYRKMTLDERRILATVVQAKAIKTKIAEVLVGPDAPVGLQAAETVSPGWFGGDPA